MVSSFFCERTAEYLLVPRFAEILAADGWDVVPFYYWATREGNRLSTRIWRDMRCRVVAMYPRRPKVEPEATGRIVVKFNHVLFRASSFFEGAGIPVFAGVPLVESLCDMNPKAHCSWFYLTNEDSPTSDIHTTLDVKTGAASAGTAACARGPMSEDEIRSLAGKARSLAWEELVGVLHEARQFRGELVSAPFPHFGGYRPVYFALVGDQWQGR